MNALNRHIRSWLKDKTGAIAIEAAFILPFLGVLGLGAMDLSFMLLQNHKMEQALVAAGNYMSRASDPQSLEAKAKQIAVNGAVGNTSSSVIKGWSESDISISYRMVANNAGQYRGEDFIRVAQISSTHPYSGLGIIKAVTRNSVTLNANYEQRMTSERP